MSAYKVMVQKSFGGSTHFFIVTDQPAGWDNYERKWPAVATFPVAVGYSVEDQHRRANEYRDYMNRTTPVQPPIGD